MSSEEPLNWQRLFYNAINPVYLLLQASCENTFGPVRCGARFHFLIFPEVLYGNGTIINAPRELKCSPVYNASSNVYGLLDGPSHQNAQHIR
jgi:hypothetical protein